MNNKDYKTLKAASKVSFIKEKVETVPELKNSDGVVVQNKQEQEVIMLTEKKWNPSTGEALSDEKKQVSLSDYKVQKTEIDANIASMTKDSEALAEIIKDIEAL